MKFALSNGAFLPYIIKHLEKDGHSVLYNSFSPDIDICIVENRYTLYEMSRLLKVIKKNKIKLINFINDIPFMHFQKGSETNSINNNIKQFLYNYTNRHRLIYEYVNKYFKKRKRSLKNNFIIDRKKNPSSLPPYNPLSYYPYKERYIETIFVIVNHNNALLQQNFSKAKNILVSFQG